MRLLPLFSCLSLLTACSVTPYNDGGGEQNYPVATVDNPLPPVYSHPVYHSSNRAEVLIQAGHEGRTSGKLGASSIYGREIKWTPVVADVATAYLRQAGISVIRIPATWKTKTYTKLAIFIHFDGIGGNDPCATGASIGYDDPSDRPAANAWKRLYSQYFPYRWKSDNFSKNLSRYYMFKKTNTKDAELVLELGAISCKRQALWLKPRLEKLGQLIAYFIAERLGYHGTVPRPQM